MYILPCDWTSFEQNPSEEKKYFKNDGDETYGNSVVACIFEWSFYEILSDSRQIMKFSHLKKAEYWW